MLGNGYSSSFAFGNEHKSIACSTHGVLGKEKFKGRSEQSFPMKLGPEKNSFCDRLAGLYIDSSPAPIECRANFMAENNLPSQDTYNR